MKQVYCIAGDNRIYDVARKKDVEAAIKVWKSLYGDVKAVPIRKMIISSGQVSQQAQELFNRMGLPYEVWDGLPSGTEAVPVCIGITWGDWRHDHANADHIMETAFGFKVIDETVTEEDGSDTYSAVHTYIPA